MAFFMLTLSFYLSNTKLIIWQIQIFIGVRQNIKSIKYKIDILLPQRPRFDIFHFGALFYVSCHYEYIVWF